MPTVPTVVSAFDSVTVSVDSSTEAAGVVAAVVLSVFTVVSSFEAADVVAAVVLSVLTVVSSLDCVTVSDDLSTEEGTLSVISDVLLSALLACSLPVPAQAVIEIKSATAVATAKNFFAFIFSYSFLK